MRIERKKAEERQRQKQKDKQTDRQTERKRESVPAAKTERPRGGG